MLAPEFQQADILLVMNHLQKKDYDAAIEAAQAYKSRHLASVTPYNLLRRAYLEAGRQDDAVASFKKALAIDAAHPANLQPRPLMARYHPSQAGSGSHGAFTRTS